jgi:hypothetical protein
MSDWDRSKSRRSFSDNVVFVDTEFTSLNPYKGEILSIGLVKFDGEELYVELECDAEPDPWVVENVLPLMSGPKLTRAEACRVVKEFVGDSRPFMVTDVGSFDAVYLYKLFGIDGHPFHWLPIDLASAVFSPAWTLKTCLAVSTLPRAITVSTMPWTTRVSSGSAMCVSSQGRQQDLFPRAFRPITTMLLHLLVSSR